MNIKITKKRYSFLIFALSILFFIICQNCSLIIKEYHLKIDADTKKYCLFLVGSYWVYEDATNSEIDSTIIVNVNNNEISHSSDSKDNHICFYQEYTMNTKTFVHDSIQIYGLNKITNAFCINDYKFEINNPSTLYCKHGIDEIKYIDLAECTLKYHNGSLYEVFKDVKYEKYYESYRIEDNLFSEVKVFLTVLPQNYQIRTYWAKEVGVIRTEYIGTDFYAVRNLIRYNVEQ